jgi:hypothetical protein
MFSIQKNSFIIFYYKRKIKLSPFTERYPHKNNQNILFFLLQFVPANFPGGLRLHGSRPQAGGTRTVYVRYVRKAFNTYEMVSNDRSYSTTAGTQ